MRGVGLAVEHSAHEIARARPHVIIDTADILAQQAQSQQLHADEDEQHGKQGEHPLHRPLGAVEQTRHQQHQAEEEAQQGDAAAEHAQQTQGEGAHAGEQIELQVEQLPQGVLGLVLAAPGVGDVHLGGAAGEAVGQHRDEGAALVALQHGVHHRAAVGTQHAAVVVHIHPGGTAHRIVHQARGEAAEQGVAPVLAHAAHHIATLGDGTQQLGDLLRRILQVGVQGHHHLAPGVGETGHDRRVLTVVAVEQHADHPPRLSGCGVGDDRRGGVRAAVVHQYDLKWALQPGADLHAAADQLIQVHLLVVYGDDQ